MNPPCRHVHALAPCPGPSRSARRAGAKRVAHPRVEQRERVPRAKEAGAVPGRLRDPAPSRTSPTRTNVSPSRAKNPQVSKEGARSWQASRLTRPWVGRMPNRPQWLAGARTDPPVSVPSAKSHRLFDTAEAEPDDEPPGMRSGAPPFTGVPKWAFLPDIEKASSSVMVLPTKRRPRRGGAARWEPCAS